MSGPDWSTVAPGLVSLFSALALPDPTNPQVPAWVAEWRDRQRKATPTSGPLDGVTLTMRITSVIGIGEDDRRLVDIGVNDPPTPFDGQIQENIYGLRRVTLNLQANASKINDSFWAMSLLESIRTRLRRGRSIQTLLDLNIGLISIGAAIDISKTQQQHVQSRASMDVLLTMVASDIDPVPTGWIQILDISSLIQDVSGVTLPVPPNFNDFIVTKPS